MDNLFQKFIDQYSSNLSLDDDAVNEIVKHLTVLTLHKNHVLLRESQIHDFAYFIIKGAARSYYLKDCTEVNTWFAFENEIVASFQNYKNLPSRETFELVENSTLISINLKTLKPLVYANIQISNFINSIIEEYTLFLEDRVYFSQFMSAMERYNNLLEREPYVLQRIPLTYIASYLGISRETLSRLRGAK